ncbi:hypothetical protein [Bacillus cereus]|uniref:hypothetical protein n=1 Tax=Bacillus cereus TaxID=1396 RepID=UPI00115E0B52|nr:hypothetical protein [Bacillus cereus]
MYQSTPLHIPIGEDVASSTCIPKRILQMETSYEKPEASTKRTNNQRNTLYFVNQQCNFLYNFEHILGR